MNLKRKGVHAEIPTASMGDIVFMLIIFFILTTTFSVNKGFDYGLPPQEQETTSSGESRPALTLIVTVTGIRDYAVRVMDEEGHIEIFQKHNIIRLRDHMNEVFQAVRDKQPENWYKLPVYILVRRDAPFEGFVDVWEEIQAVEEVQLDYFPAEEENRKLATHIPNIIQVEDILTQYVAEGKIDPASL